MPQIIEHFVPERKGGQRSKYPWQEWFRRLEHETSKLEGRALMLHQGVDYNCQTEAMVNRIRKQARLSNIRLTIHRVENGLVIMYNGRFEENNHASQQALETERGNPRQDVRQHPPTPQRRQQQDRKRR